MTVLLTWLARRGLAPRALHCLAALMLAAAGSAGAAAKTATLSGGSRSIVLRQAVTNEPGRGLATTVWTTYDGSAAYPLHETNGSTPVFSWEARPRAGGAGVYEVDYARRWAPDTAFTQWGSMVFELPADPEGGLPAWARYDTAAAAPFTGWMTNDISGLAAPLTGSFQRAANSASGPYWIQAGGGAPAFAVSNVWRIGYCSGSVEYTRGHSNGVFLRFSLTDPQPQPQGRTYSVSGTASFTVPDAGSVVLSPCALKFEYPDNNGDTTNYMAQAQALTLRRVGTRYLGDLILADGNGETSWPDFTTWALEVTDFNDTDGNGIPDLSDTVYLAPEITAAPASRTAPAGGELRLEVAAEGTAPLAYQWYWNGSRLQESGRIHGATTSALWVSGVQAADAGSYTVVVSNLLGAVTSSPPAVITVKEPPRIVSGPSNVFRLQGQMAVLSAAGTGAAPLAWQWLKNGIPLADQPRFEGVQTASLVVRGLRLEDGGVYTVVITNAAGAVTSAPALLALDTTRLAPNDWADFAETNQDRVVSSSDGGPVYYEVDYTYRAQAAAGFYWQGFGETAFDPGLVLTVSAGRFNYSRTVSQAVAVGASRIEFLDRTYTNDWTGEVLQFAVTLARQGDAVTLGITNTEYVLNSTNLDFAALGYWDAGVVGAVQGSVELKVSFGPWQWAKTIPYQGTVSVGHNEYSSSPGDEYLYDIRLNGSASRTTPQARILGPAAGSKPARHSVVSGDAWDGSGVAQVWVKVNQSPYALAFGTTNWSCPVWLAPGSNYIQIQAVNGLGNSSDPQGIAVAAP